MRESRNPFKLRIAEKIENDETFLRLFSPSILDSLNADEIWTKPLFISSAPGGGKTTLLRLMTPTVLRTLHSLRTREQYRDLAMRLKAIGAIDEGGPLVLGIMLRGGMRKYRRLSDAIQDNSKALWTFFALLDARIMLATLRSVTELKDLAYPADLARVSFSVQRSSDWTSHIPMPCTGQVLYEWAIDMERRIGESLDPFSSANSPGGTAHDGFESLRMLADCIISIDGKPAAKRIVILLDDLHELSSVQWDNLRQEVQRIRPSVGIWLSQRMEAIDPKRILAETMGHGRDYVELRLEEYWSRSKGKSFEKMARNVADLRSRSSSEIEVGEFASYLGDSLDSGDWDDEFLKAQKECESRLKDKIQGNSRYSKWFTEVDEFRGTPQETAIRWRSLEILISRDERKKQGSLEFGPLPIEELNQCEDSDVRNAAEVFLHKEIGIPMYFGMERLARLSSHNLQQFLWLAGEIFEGTISSFLLKKSGVLNPGQQEKILKRVIKEEWERRQQNFDRNVHNLISSIVVVSREKTFLSNAPYSPGVSGVAISMKEAQTLTSSHFDAKTSPYGPLLETLSLCIANGLLEVRRDCQCKGKTWMVFYLNRTICVYNDLAINYGGWREQSLKTLSKWTEIVYQSPKRNGTLS